MLLQVRSLFTHTYIYCAPAPILLQIFVSLCTLTENNSKQLHRKNPFFCSFQKIKHNIGSFKESNIKQILHNNQMLYVKGQKVDPTEICNNVKEKPEKFAEPHLSL